MQGYSVTEAASVLGVPTERVWELLARGVLSGAPEGDTGMRVYLQPRPAPAPPEEARPNGHGSEPERELSPFRELLTEFRNLTERYGQALLALGEARGEVASLRSRVDLLEARMDLRLPMGEPAPTTRWASTPVPMTAERAVVDTAPTEPVPAAPPVGDQAADPDHADEEHRARPRGPRRATESFAAALARADDPSVPELPSGPEPGPAVLDAHDGQEEAPEAVLPRELPAAETMPVADEPMPEAVVAIDDDEPAIEAEPRAEEAGEGAIVDRAAAEEPAPAAFVAAEPIGDVEPEPAVQPLEVSPEPVDVAAIPAAVEIPEPDPQPEPMPEPEAEATVPDSASAGALTEPSDPAEPLEWDAERYTTEIEAPDWLEAEAFEPEPIPTVPEVEPPARRADPPPAVLAEPAEELPLAEAADTAEGAPAELLEPDAESVPEAGAPAHPAEIDPAAAEASSSPVDEETILWFGRSPEPRTGADEMEVSAAQTRPVPAATETASTFPGSQELDEALAALDAIGTTAEAADDEPDEWPPASAGVIGASESPSPRPSVEMVPVRPASTQIGSVGSPATRAYRRLRRIFPD